MNYNDTNALEQRCRELEDLQYVYNNTPFAHWVERCKELEAENALLKKRLEPIEEIASIYKTENEIEMESAHIFEVIKKYQVENITISNNIRVTTDEK